MSSIELTNTEINLTSEFTEYQRLYAIFTEVRSSKFKPVVRYFKMRTAAVYINKKVKYILTLHNKLPESLQLKHNQLIKHVSEESTLVNDLVNAEKTKLFTVETGMQVKQPLPSPKTKKFLRHVTPKKSGKRWQLRKPDSPLNSPKRLSNKFSLSNLKGSGSGSIKFKFSQEVIKYHQLYEEFIALEKSKIKRVVRYYEMRKAAQNLNMKFEQILNIRKQLPELEPSKEDAIFKQVSDNHARINSVISNEDEKSSDQKPFTPRRQNKTFKNFFKRRDSTPRKIAEDPKTTTPKKAKVSLTLARQLSYEFISNNSKEPEERNGSKLHEWVSSAVLKLKRSKITKKSGKPMESLDLSNSNF